MAALFLAHVTVFVVHLPRLLAFFVAFGGAWRLSVLAILDGWQLGFVCVAFFCSSMSACVSVVLLNIYAVVFGHIGHFLAFFGLFWLL